MGVADHDHSTGASRVHVFSHIVRSQAWDSVLEAGKDLGDKETQATRTSARFIHVGESILHIRCTHLD